MEDTQLSTLINSVNDMQAQLMKALVNLACISSRLDSLEQMMGNNVAPKRSIKVATSSTVEDSTPIAPSKRKTVTAKPSAVASSTSASSEIKVANALAFFKKIIMAGNYNNLREVYTTEENMKLVKVDNNLVPGTEAYWVSVGAEMWKNVLTKEQRDNLRLDLSKWRKVHQGSSDPSQLNEDNVE